MCLKLLSIEITIAVLVYFIDLNIMTKTKAKHEKNQIIAKITMSSIETVISKEIQDSTISGKEYIFINVEINRYNKL